MPPSPHPALRTARACALTLLLAALGLCLSAGAAWARKGDSRAGLFVGTTTFAVQDYTTFGTTFGGSYGLEIQDDLLWSSGLAFSSTDGETTVTDSSGNERTVALHATSSEFRTGLVNYLGRSAGGAVLPYIGGGLSVINYSLDFPGTTVGTTSGTGPGAFVLVGVELRLSRSVTVIPQFGVQAHSIKTESGDSTGLLSGGLTITVRIST